MLIRRNKSRINQLLITEAEYMSRIDAEAVVVLALVDGSQIHETEKRFQHSGESGYDEVGRGFVRYLRVPGEGVLE